jgi:hypothetical protein
VRTLHIKSFSVQLSIIIDLLNIPAPIAHSELLVLLLPAKMAVSVVIAVKVGSLSTVVVPVVVPVVVLVVVGTANFGGLHVFDV